MQCCTRQLVNKRCCRMWFAICMICMILWDLCCPYGTFSKNDTHISPESRWLYPVVMQFWEYLTRNLVYMPLMAVSLEILFYTIAKYAKEWGGVVSRLWQQRKLEGKEGANSPPPPNTIFFLPKNSFWVLSWRVANKIWARVWGKGDTYINDWLKSIFTPF